MKTTLFRAVSSGAFSAAIAALVFAGCSREERAEARTKTSEAYAETRDTLSDAWKDVKSYTFEKRGDFTAEAKALSSKMEAQVSKLHATYADAKASASRKAAMAELKDSEADYKQKLDALSHATADTWESAKQNVIASWDRLQASYYKARTD